MSMTDLAFVALHTSGELRGENVRFERVSTDTRSLQAGDLFVALAGPHFDGHDFCAEAAKAGAVALLVSRPVNVELPQLVVDDTRLALGRLAQAWRAEFNIPLIAVTGSNGKTTVKQMLASILSERGAVHATRGNLNNDIGVPLTLLALRKEHEFAVIEMGANHVGEIAYLADLVRPNIGVVTNAGEAHLEGFGDLDGVIQGKGELFAGVMDGGTCVINGDQPWSDEWKARAGMRRKLTFGMAGAQDFHVTGAVSVIDAKQIFAMATPDGEISVELPLLGQHNVMNALAAAAAAWSAGASLEQIAAGLAKVRNVGGRLERIELTSGALLIDDTYNANPVSMRAAVDWLSNCGRRAWLVMGDMGELGGDAGMLHKDAGEYARERGIERLYTLGAFSRLASEAFGEGGLAFDSAEALCARLRDDLTGVDAGTIAVLVKGSRSARMERVVRCLRDEGNV